VSDRGETVAGLLQDHLDDGTAIDIGDDHFITFYSYRETEKAGVIIYHKRRDEDVWCMGSVLFALPGTEDSKYGRWHLVNYEPLHIEPSVLCRAPHHWEDGKPVGSCDDHGFIRGGKWVRA